MKRITPGEYLEEMNRRLAEHPDFVAGMRFIFAPPKATADTALGYTWEPDPRVMHPFADIASAVQREFLT